MANNLDKGFKLATRAVVALEKIAGSLITDAVDQEETMSTIDFGTSVALGLESGFTIGTKFGRNSEIDTITAPEAIWEGGGEYTGQPELGVPETVDIVSDSVNDAVGGTGARTIRIFGLAADDSTEYEFEDLSLDGTTPVTSNKVWRRINRVIVLTAGTGLENEGTITISHTITTANVFASVQPGYNQSLIAAYTVPFGQKIIIKRIRVSIARASGAAGSANITLRVRETGGVFRTIRNFEATTAEGIDFAYFGGEVLTGGTDIKFRVESVSDNDTIAEAAFEYILAPE